MIYTAQTIADNGSIRAPWGNEYLYHCQNRTEVNDVLDEWGNDVGRFNPREDAYLIVWCREHHSDVTDLYPDFKVSYGPRGGIRWKSV